ncbi:MAG: DUF1330 domain-containing protein [Gammaproteobacteria bacterium]|nr:DUF1330 domain-containing protein [Gammaproteobacteria bacterium]MDH5799392.1 DUF1330 domain-containing protein [Gammaproteobacteria bacterium]
MNAYLILDISIHDLLRFRKYIKKIPAFIQKHSGRYVVQGVEPIVKEGDWHPQRVVVIEFPSRDQAENFLSDPDAQALFQLRHETTTSKLILVDGCLEQ